MSSLPMRRNDFQLHSFLAFLSEQGAEIGKPTNQYEVVRYRYWHPEDRKAGTHIVYAKENGRLTFTGSTREHYSAFMKNESLGGKLVTKKSSAKPSKSKDIREKLLQRDGNDCWFCGTHMGDDCTIEHLIPKSKGGRNILSNYALAHASCNQKAANIPLVEKMALRAKMRGENV